MKQPENKYDDPVFFEKYGQMPRSTGGLNEAGEWEVFKRLLPALKNKRVLDIGCGYGWHCRYASENGASSVLGTDVSEKMLEKARSMTKDPRISYRRLAIENVNFPPGSFDLVLSSLAFHYIAPFAEVCRHLSSCLTPGGDFIFSVEHPVFTSSAPQNWCKGENGNNRHWPVDNYFSEGPRAMVFLDENITKYHRTVTGYVQPLLAAGFSLESMIEPEPPARFLEKHPDEFRRPMFLLVSAKKK